MYLAIDIGGTSGKIAVFDKLDDPSSHLGGETFTMTKRSDEGGGDINADIRNLVNGCRSMFYRYGAVEGIGISIAGKLNASKSSLELGGNLEHWVGFPIASPLEEAFGVRVVVDNDAVALALAEAVYGIGSAGRLNGRDFIGMIWGSGIGGACIRYASDGSYVPIAGEPGHLIIGPDNGIRCGCGQPGCVESYAGGNNLEQYFDKPVINPDDPSHQMNDRDWRTALDWLAKGMKQYLLVQPVDLIIFSGGVACKQQKQRGLLDELQELLASPVYGSPEIHVSQFGESAGSLGALSLLSR
jgi:predicted NBD/HSP70 family sugar kinase